MMVVVWCFRASVRRGEDKNEAEVNKLHHPDSKEIKTKLGPSKNFVRHFANIFAEKFPDVSQSQTFLWAEAWACVSIWAPNFF
jgi:hypothetical protein